MLRFLALWLAFVLGASALYPPPAAAGTVFIDEGPVPGGGVPIIEKVLGFNGAGSVAASVFAPSPTGFSQGTVTATWVTGPATNVNITKGYLKSTAWDGNSNWKLVIYNNSNGAVLGVSDALNFTANDTYMVFNFSTPVSITKGTAYRIGWYHDTGFQRIYTCGTAGTIEDTTVGTYATPGTWGTNSSYETSKDMCMYFEADTK